MASDNQMLYYINNKNEQTQKILNRYSYYLELAVKFGAQILTWEPIDPIDKTPVTGLFLRNYLDLLDSMSVLVKHGSTEAAKIILRSLFEINLYIHFICEKHTLNRACSFLVIDTLNQISDLDRMLLTNNGGRELKEKICKEKWLTNFGTKHSVKDILDRKKELNEYLVNPYFNDVIEEYNRLKKRCKGKIKWHYLFEGKNSIESLAVYLKKYTLYKILYKEWSKSTHGSNIIKNKISQSEIGQISYYPIREPRGLMFPTKMACNITINTLGYYIKTIHSDQAKVYDEWESKFCKDITFDLDHELISFAL